MNYYPHHIGDFNTRTLHLSRLERGIYRDMRDLYFDKEAPLLADVGKLFRLLRITTPEEVEAAKAVLDDFFVLTDAGWEDAACAADIQSYYDSLEAASAGGKAAKKKREDAARLAAEQQAVAAQLAQSALDFTHAQFAHGASTVPEQCANSSGTVRDGANQNQNQNQNKNQEQPPAPGTLSIDREGGATAVDLSIAFRKAGVQTQPADPRLHALAEQGVGIDTVQAACVEAKKSKPNGGISIGYVLGILQRWAGEAQALSVAGALPPARAAPGGGAAAKDQARQETLDGLTGSGQRTHERPHDIIDITPERATASLARERHSRKMGESAVQQDGV